MHVLAHDACRRSSGTEPCCISEAAERSTPWRGTSTCRHDRRRSPWSATGRRGHVRCPSLDETGANEALEPPIVLVSFTVPSDMVCGVGVPDVHPAGYSELAAIAMAWGSGTGRAVPASTAVPASMAVSALMAAPPSTAVSASARRGSGSGGGVVVRRDETMGRDVSISARARESRGRSGWRDRGMRRRRSASPSGMPAAPRKAIDARWRLSARLPAEREPAGTPSRP